MGCYNSIVVDAPADQVWNAVRDFHNMSKFPNVVTSCEVVGDVPGTQVGAKRILNDAFHETLHAIDDTECVMRYSIDDGPEAVSKDNVSGYYGEVRIFPITDNNTTFVLWTSKWENSGGGVAEFCSPVYQALLADLKGSFA